MSLFNKVFGGKKAMSALSTGTKAPQFELPAMDGSQFSLQDALTRGPVLTVFFKISCPVCQYALPYFERIYKAYGGSKLTIVGVSQNDKTETAEFARKFGVSFPILLDDTKTFSVSNSYGLNTVPTSFWIAEDGEIELSNVSWVRKEFENIAAKAASISGATPVPMFQPSEKIADFRAG